MMTVRVSITALVMCHYAAPVPALDLPDLFLLGVGTHMGQGRTSEELVTKKLNELQLSGVRDDVYWSYVEREKGVFSAPAATATVIAKFNSGRLTSTSNIVVLAYGNNLYGGGQPKSPEAQVAYANYAAWVAAQFKAPTAFEIWNEWDIGAGGNQKGKDGDPIKYAELVSLAAKEIKSVNPQATVLAGAIGKIDSQWPWLVEVANHGLPPFVDGISIHLYNHSEPNEARGAFGVLEKLKRTGAKLSTKDPTHPIPLYVTEFGFPTHLGGFSLNESARHTIGALFGFRAIDNVKGAWIYELQDGGIDRYEREQNFGLLSDRGEDKPVACILSKVAEVIRRGRLVLVKNSENAIAVVLKDECCGAIKTYLAVIPRGNGMSSKTSAAQIYGSLMTNPVDLMDGCQPGASDHRVLQTATGFEVITSEPTFLRFTGTVLRIELK